MRDAIVWTVIAVLLGLAFVPALFAGINIIWRAFYAAG